MFRQIVELLKVRKNHTPTRPEWVRKLPEMAKKLEESLYRSANSFDEYKDELTVDFRVKPAGYLNKAGAVGAAWYAWEQEQKAK